MENREYQKVLFVAYYYPPVGGGGVQRSAKFVKYLPQFGWLPCVLTVKNPYDFYEDSALSSDIPNFVPVFRSRSIEPMKWVRKLILKKWKNKISHDVTEIKPKQSVKHPILVKLKQYILIPDNEILWFPFAIWKGLRIIQKEKPQAIYSTASPFTAHLIALFLARISNLPWNADFRDFWVDRPNFPQLKWRKFIDRKMESWVLKRATHITTVSTFIGERFQKLSPAVTFTTIPNGYDESDFKLMEDEQPNSHIFNITYTGIFNKEQNPRNFFLAVRHLIQQREEIHKKLRLKFIGQLDNPGDFDNFLLLKELGLDDYSDIIPYQPHHLTIQEMKNATILLLLVGEYPLNQAVLTGKLFEYLRARKVILAVVPLDGSAAEIVRQTKSGLIVSNKDIAAISAGISSLFDSFQNGTLEKQFLWENIEHFERRELTKKLAEILSKISNASNEPV